MINAGIGPEQLNKLLTAMNIPPISHHSLKKREIEVGKKVEQVAVDSCNMAIQEERLQLKWKLFGICHI